MSGPMWPCGKSYGLSLVYFLFLLISKGLSSKRRAAILIDGHKLQLNTFFICLILVVPLFELTSGVVLEIEVKILITNDIDKRTS